MIIIEQSNHFFFFVLSLSIQTFLSKAKKHSRLLINGSDRLDEHRFFDTSLIFIGLNRAITRGNVAHCIMRVHTRSYAETHAHSTHELPSSRYLEMISNLLASSLNKIKYDNKFLKFIKAPMEIQ